MNNRTVLNLMLSGFLILYLITGCKTEKLISNEGFIEVTGGKVWYRIEGQKNKAPMLILHGGPGSSTYSLTSLNALGKDRQIIFMDQLGSGRSERITDTTLMTIENFVEQVEQVRKQLNLKDFYLYGHSWGTMLGLDYYLKYPNEIKGIIFNSPLFSTNLWVRDADTLIATLPDSIQADIRTNEAAKTYKNEAYLKAVDLFYSKFLCRTTIRETMADTLSLYFAANIYEHMWGPSEFTATGNLVNYNRLEELKTINIPTLLLTGEFDEARPNTVKYYASLVPGSTFKVVKNAAHRTMIDNPIETNEIISEFLMKTDGG